MKVKTVDVLERLDAASVPEFKEQVTEIMGEDDTLLIINFRNTRFIDSAGLGALVSALKIISTKESSKIALIELSPQINQIFELTKLYRLFNIYKSQQEAEEDLNN